MEWLRTLGKVTYSHDGSRIRLDDEGSQEHTRSTSRGRFSMHLKEINQSIPSLSSMLGILDPRLLGKRKPVPMPNNTL